MAVGLEKGWVTQRMWFDYRAGLLLNDDRTTRYKAYRILRERHRALTEFPSLMRSIDRRIPTAADESILDLVQYLANRDFIESHEMPHLKPKMLEIFDRVSLGEGALADRKRFVGQMLWCSSNGMYVEMEPYLLRLARDDDREIRWRVLCAATRNFDESDALLAMALDDPDLEIVRTAWFHVAFNNPAGGYSANWHDAPDGAAEAILYAAVATSDHPEAVISQIGADPSSASRFAWVMPFLGRQAALAAGSRFDRADMPNRLSALHREPYLSESELREMPRLEEPRALMVLLDYDEEPTYSAIDVVRAMFDDHPIPDGPLSDQQQEFAKVLLQVWWSVYWHDYEFDEEAQVFRRIEQNEKSPE